MLRPTPEELLNTITHAIGFVLSVAGAAVLLQRVYSNGDVWRWAGCSVYAVALVGVYGCSTLSHSAAKPELKRRFRMLDQGFIYLLIVGTYTPFALAYLRTSGWLVFLGVMWAIALWGFHSKIFMAHRVDAVAVWVYLLLGWMPVVAGVPLLKLVPAWTIWWMLLGGACYTLGTVFLINDHRNPQFHAAWHLMVMAGSAFHFVAIFRAIATV